MKNKIKKMTPVLFWVFVWFIASLLINREVYLPSPLQVIHKAFDLMGSKSFYLSIASTISRGLVAFLFSTLIGVIIGFLCHFSNLMYRLTLPIINVLRSVPVISIIFLIILYTDAKFTPIVVSFILCFPLIWTTTVNGLRTIPKNLINMSNLYKVPLTEKLFFMYLPGILPELMSTMISAFGLTWKVIATAEALTQPEHSIGKFLSLAKYSIDTVSLFTWTMMLIIISMIFEKILRSIFNKALKKRYGVIHND